MSERRYGGMFRHHVLSRFTAQELIIYGEITIQSDTYQCTSFAMVEAELARESFLFDEAALYMYSHAPHSPSRSVQDEVSRGRDYEPGVDIGSSAVLRIPWSIPVEWGLAASRLGSRRFIKIR